MKKLLAQCAFSLVVMLSALPRLQAQLQSPYQPVDTFNNTSACSNAGNNSSTCYSPAEPFPGMVDAKESNYKFNPSPQNTSTVSIMKLLPQGSATFAFTEYQPWFCIGTCSAGSHVDTGYNEQDAATYEAQIADMEQRGYQGTIIDYYGKNSSLTSLEAVSEDISNYLKNATCQNCYNGKFYFALMYDPGALTNNSACGTNGNANACKAAAASDVADMWSIFVNNNPAYLKVGGTPAQVSTSGQPVLLTFSNFGGDVFFQNSYVTIYRSDLIADAQSSWGEQPLLIIENATLNSYSSYGGDYAWINHYPGYGYCTASDASVDPFGYCYLQNFYDSGVGYKGLNANFYAQGKAIMGAGWKGFDKSLGYGGVDPDYTSTFSEQCGLTWVNAFSQITAPHNDFTSTNPLRLFQVATWNDYDEGTEIETGIDDCLTDYGGTGIRLSAPSGTNLSWTLGYGTEPAITYGNYQTGATSGSTATLDHFALWEQIGSSWTQISDPNAGFAGASNCSGTGNYNCGPVPMPAYNWSAGNHTLYVQTVGVSSVWNHLSNSVTFTAEPQPVYNPTSITFPNTNVGSTSPATITISNASTATAVLVIASSGVSITSNPSGVFSANYAGCSGAAPDSSCPSLTVNFTPTGCSQFNGTLVITDNATTNNQQTIPLQGTGISGGNCNPSTFNPTSYGFGNVLVGNNSSEQFAFTNNSGATITPAFAYHATSGPGTDFSITPGSSCTNLANGAICPVTLKFAPSQAVSYSGTLTASNGTTTLASAPISGTGYTSDGSKVVLYGQLQLMNGWVSCTQSGSSCAGGNGGAVANYQPNLSSPSEPNVLNPNQTANSTDFGLSKGTSNGYSNVKYELQLGAEDQVTQFELDADVYIDNPNAPQALVFTLAKAVSNNFYPFQFECDLQGTKVWHVWDPGTSNWVQTSVGCTASQFPASTWVHLVFQMNITGNTLNYTGVGVGTAQPLSGFSGYPPATQSPDSLDVIIVLDGNSTETPFNMYVDNMIVYDIAPAPSASFTPATLDLGTVSGTSAERYLTLTNSGQGPFNISSVAVNNQTNFTLYNQCPALLSAQSSCQIGVVYNSSGYGTQSGTVTVMGSATVTANVTGTTLNPANVIYSNMQNDAWSVCNTIACAGGDGGATSTYTPAETNVEINGQQSGLALFSGSPTYSNSKFQDVKGAQDSYSVFQMDMDIYVSDPTKPQNLQFGVAQAISNKYYAFQFMCDLKGGGVWRIWNLGQSTWVATSNPCTSQSFAAADWTHLTFTVQRTSGNQMQYLSLAVGAATYPINSGPYNTASKSPDDIEGLLIESGDSIDEGYSMYLSNVNISHQ